ncbi:MAG: diaminopimelate epimerase [Lentisphaeria bacterium]
MNFSKYHALGNDYLVISQTELGTPVESSRIQTICHRHFGLGGDGILAGPISPSEPDFAKLAEQADIGDITENTLCGLRIFNPDGSEAEKSGNGLRIFCRYLYDTGQIAANQSYYLLTLGGIVKVWLEEGAREIAVDMGQVSFQAADIPVQGENGEVIEREIKTDSGMYQFSAATIGNPHCIVLTDNLSTEEVKKVGPLLENHAAFPNRTNVQFMQVVDRHLLNIEIWERGAGYTLASGSSACACAAIARKLDLCDPQVTVKMPGGKLNIDIDDSFQLSLRGGVTAVAKGELQDEIFS